MELFLDLMSGVYKTVEVQRACLPVVDTSHRVSDRKLNCVDVS